MAGLIACVYAGAVWCIWVFTNRVILVQGLGAEGGNRMGYPVTFSVLLVLCEIIRYSLNHNGGSRPKAEISMTK